jgi:hypothetical protein
MQRQNPINGPVKNRLRQILEELLDKSIKSPGYPARRGVHNGLGLAVKTKGGKTELQIDRANPGPNGTEWNTVLRNWPFPCKEVKITIKHWQGRVYWSASWETEKRQAEAELGGDLGDEPCSD